MPTPTHTLIEQGRKERDTVTAPKGSQPMASAHLQARG